MELQVIGILDREGGQVVRASRKVKFLFERSVQVRNETKLANYFQRLVTSILLHSTATPIHLIVLTEQESLAAIRRDLKNQIGRHLSTSIIRRPTPDIVNFVHLFPKYLANQEFLFVNLIMCRIRTDFVSLSSIVEPHRKEIDRMKQHFGHHMPVGTKFKVMMDHYLFKLIFCRTRMGSHLCHRSSTPLTSSTSCPSTTLRYKFYNESNLSTLEYSFRLGLAA